MQPEQATTDLLIIENYHVRAATGKRFLNYVIDLIVFYALVFGGAMVLAILAPDTISQFAEQPDTSGSVFRDQILALVLYALYMAVIEASLKGKSLGKLITRTRAVNLDGSPISATTAFARGFARAVPFCVFSAFGSPCNPWQDKWTNTMVIDEKKSDLQ